MSNLISKEVAKEFFNLEDKDLDCFILVERLREWADINYPRTKKINRASFAGLVAYFITGAYSGYGTELYQKERIIEHRIRWFHAQLYEKLSEKELSLTVINFIIINLLPPSPLEKEIEEGIKKAIKDLEQTKKTFKSKQIEKIKNDLETLIN